MDYKRISEVAKEFSDKTLLEKGFSDASIATVLAAFGAIATVFEKMDEEQRARDSDDK